ncbi:carbohydrate ABC transporter permease [Fimbriimonas ginsengisoli]|uniref:N-Acetyl-D-glucosamine ABC transport system, permease protein 2 n=1 Tax=Fimbriimonas ginsengisoli Gsoil 348 TaxID=661478 RepID=A0A068NKL0_FIMGI|nr:carbohydrate ABC transporter permease [Fimbriimonas ginsengisoli]AIE84083.1 N-Acetyl-D-glucosamine ABC transport system, permease protein 2 [Fimbriimonas ginsengisoli Gsoil 348]
MQSQRNVSLVQKFFVQLALIVFGISFAFPFVWLLSTALKTLPETMKDPPQWIPAQFQWHNFWDAINYGSESVGYVPFEIYARNTLLVCVLVVCGTVASNSVVAYSFARLKWPGRDALFAVTLATMMVPFPVLMVPTFGIFRSLDWIGTFRPLWVPAWFGSAFSIFLLRQFFRTIPFELSEAAKIDGASEWRIFRDVIIPLSKPALAVVALFAFMGAWNDFIGPLIYLLDQKMFTLSLGLQSYQSQNGGTQWNLLMAASTIVILPIIILFFFTQRLFIQGIAVTGLKG